MSLSSVQTKLLLTVVNQSVARLSVERDNLYAIIPSDEAFDVVAQSFNTKFAACIKIKKMAEKTIDEAAIDGMETNHFNVIIHLIGVEIDGLHDAIDNLIVTDVNRVIAAKKAIQTHIDVLSELSRNLLGMFTYS
jgi:hypothetical protein